MSTDRDDAADACAYVLGVDWASKERDHSAMASCKLDPKSKQYRELLDHIKTGTFAYHHQESLMFTIKKSATAQELRALVEEYPDGTPTMLAGAAIDRIKQADPGANISDVINDALKAHAAAAENQELVRKKRSHKLDRALEMVRASLVKLLAAEARLEAGVQCSADAQAIDDILGSAYRKVRTAGSNIRNAYSLRSKTLRSNPHSPRGRMTPRRFY